MQSQPYYYDPFHYNVQPPNPGQQPPVQEQQQPTNTPPTGVPYQPEAQPGQNAQGAPYQPGANGNSPGHGYVPQGGYVYQPMPGNYGNGGYQPGYQYAAYGSAQAPVLDERSMEQISQANQERQQITKKGNAAGAVLLLYTLFAAVFSLLLTAPQIQTLYQSSSLMQNSVYIFYSILCVGAATWLATAKMRRNSKRVILPAKKVSITDTAVYVVVGFGLCLAANLVTNVFINILSLFGIDSSPGSDLPVTSVFGLVLAVVAMAVIPAVVEESAFRGAVLQPLRDHGEKTAILLSAILFGVFHGNLKQIPFAIMVGLVLAFVTIKTGSILPAILIHFVNNANSVVIGYLFDKYGDEKANLIFYCIMGVVGVSAVVLVLLSHLRGKGDLFRLNKPQEMPQYNPYALTTGKKVKAFLTAPCMIAAWVVTAWQIIATTDLSWF